jgi:hypothetical protein
MRRRRFQQAETGISLFPFMAVLICTMGTLIVLLMVVVRQAKVRADTVSQEQVEQRQAAAAAREAGLADRRMERDTHQWRYEELQGSREKTAGQLAEQRLKLAHIEDHSRRLEDELKRLLQEDEALKRLNDDRQLGQQTSQAELDELKRRVENERASLAAARQEAEQRPRSYAIIPYDGPHGTNRRPIYIECREDRVILQPEGIVFEADDFFDAANPGNPLAACLRAIRAYWTRVGGQGVGDDAYPLLIVRPGGAESYLGCREAMKSWDDEFGYELISDDIQLAFPPTDPALVDVLTRTVKDARRFQERLRFAKLAQIKNEERRPYLRTTSSQGGFVMEGDGTGTGRETSRSSGGSDTDERPGANGAAAARGEGGLGRGDLASGHRENHGHWQPSRGGQPSGSGQPSGGGQPPRGGQPSGGGFDPAGENSPVRGTRRFGGPGTVHRSTETGAPSPAGDSRPTDREGSFAGSSRSPQHGGQGTPGQVAGDADGGRERRPGERQYVGGENSSAAGAAADAEPSLAETRGRDWAVPHAARGSTGVNRPIRVICAADQLTIVPQRGSGQSLKAIPMRGTTKDAVDQFISTLWQHIEDWGIAGPRMYWKPELNVVVAPGGQPRFEQLKQLLQDSGIQVRQKAR